MSSARRLKGSFVAVLAAASAAALVVLTGGCSVSEKARPHPSPLPQERVNRLPVSGDLEAAGGRTIARQKGAETEIATVTSETPNTASAFSLSPGERAGVRASVPSELDSPHGADLRRYEFKQPHMGTLFAITLYAPHEASAKIATAAAFAKIAALDRMMTDYDPESELMQLCQKPYGQPVRVSDELFDILQKSQRVAELSDGAFDVTIGPVIRLWRRSRRTESLPPPDALARARQSVGYKKLKLDPRHKTVTLTAPNMQLDLGGIAKGYAADKALEVLKRHGIKRALVAASGDLAIGDPPPGKPGWRVSIGGPSTDSARSGEASQRAGSETGAPIVRTLSLRNAAISTSGDTEQFVEIAGQRYSHIVDPRTGVGLTGQLQVSIIAKRATDTDSFATAVSVLGVEHGLALVNSQPGMAALVLRKRGEVTEVFSSRRWKKLQPPSP